MRAVVSRAVSGRVLGRGGRVLGRASGALLAMLLLASAPREAHADTFLGTRFDLEERADSVDVRLDHGHATLVVTRVVENPGARSDQAMFHIDMPEGGVATRLRTAGIGKRGEPIWFEGELMEAEAAAKKYQELTGIGGYYPKDPALLSWRSQRHLALQVFPVPSRSTKTVEYTIRMPMAYDDGAYHMTLSKLGTEALPAKMRFVSVNPEEAIEVNGIGVLPGAVITSTRDLEVRLKPKPIASASLEGALASFGFAADRVLVHARVATPARLSQVPANASIVVLLDASVSMQQSFEAERTAARAYLSHFPNASVEVLTFDRKVNSPFGGPIPARDAIARLYALKDSFANGSHVDEAIARADAKLAQSPAPPAARRIVLFTDLKTREALTADKFAQRTLASGALLHLATMSGGSASLLRDDESAWAKLPRASGGLLWHATCDGGSATNDVRAVFEELARPKRIDRVKVTGLPDLASPERLEEGMGIDHLQIAKAPVTQVTIEGELWSRPVRFAMSPAADEAKKWAALVFGSPVLSELTEPEQMTLAMHGGAVSPVTSYLAIEPGVRPSTEGLEPGELGSGSGVGVGQGFGSGHGRLGSTRTSSLDRQAFLDNELKKAATKCGARADQGVTSNIESTNTEIVEVRDTAITPARDAKMESCISEELWAISLPSQFTEDHETWALARR